MKKNFLSIYLPMWATDLLKPERAGWREVNLEGEAPASPKIGHSGATGVAPSMNRAPPGTERPALLLYTKAANQVVVARYCRKAQAAGVRTGMLLSMARLLAMQGEKEPDTIPFDAEYSFLALCRLALWALKFSPLVALDEELLASYKEHSLAQAGPLHDGLILDITGTERWHSGFEKLISGLRRAFAKKDFEAKFAIAPTAGAAWALARFSRQPVTVLDPAVKLEEALALLPINALRLSSGTIHGLKELGIQTVRQLMQIPKPEILRRFEPQVIRRLEQALGQRSEALHFAKAKENFEAARSFEVPLNNQDHVATVIQELFKKVLMQLSARSKKAGTFLLEIEKMDFKRERSFLRKEISLYHASNNQKHIAAVIEPIAESVQSEGGVCSVKVSARLASQAKHLQEVIFVRDGMTGEPGVQAGGELINHLLIKLGRNNVKQAYFESSWIPEKSFSYRPVQSHDKSNAAEHISYGRPPCLLNPPEPMQAMALLPDAPPARIIWKGERLKILQAEGPERLSAEWWHEPLTGEEKNDLRDYFRVQDETGRWLWIYRDQKNGGWFVHGLWA